MAGSSVEVKKQEQYATKIKVISEHDIKQQLKSVRENIKKEPQGTRAYLSGHFVQAG